MKMGGPLLGPFGCPSPGSQAQPHGTIQGSNPGSAWAAASSLGPASPATTLGLNSLTWKAGAPAGFREGGNTKWAFCHHPHGTMSVTPILQHDIPSHRITVRNQGDNPSRVAHTGGSGEGLQAPSLGGLGSPSSSSAWPQSLWWSCSQGLAEERLLRPQTPLSAPVGDKERLREAEGGPAPGGGGGAGRSSNWRKQQDPGAKEL